MKSRKNNLKKIIAQRRKSYGDPKVVFKHYGQIFTGLLGQKLKNGAVITATDVASLMTALKLARNMNKSKRDNITDAHGFLLVLEEIEGW